MILRLRIVKEQLPDAISMSILRKRGIEERAFALQLLFRKAVKTMLYWEN